MRYVCDAPGGETWFRIETEPEAVKEKEKAAQSYQPPSKTFFEQEIGLKAHLQREMPLFLTLRDSEGNALATAMLPPAGRDDRTFRSIVVGPGNGDPYPEHGEAIKALASHLGIALERERCYPYRRG
jgi:hypothetical protein